MKTNELEIDDLAYSLSKNKIERIEKLTHKYRPFKKEIQEWCNHLRSGEYNQTKYVLKDNVGFCCLGVLADTSRHIKKEVDLGNCGDIDFSLIKYDSPAWPCSIHRDFHEITGIFLDDLNDNYDATFDEIADLLEAVFIHEVLL